MIRQVFILTTLFLFVLPALSMRLTLLSISTNSETAAGSESLEPLSVVETRAPPDLRGETRIKDVAGDHLPAFSSSSSPESEKDAVLESVRAPAREGPSKRLGYVGTETPEFEKKCKSCCERTKSEFQEFLPFLKRCSSCTLKADAPFTSSCPRGSVLGYSNTPDGCFRERCQKMLTTAGPCFCLRT